MNVVGGVTKSEKGDSGMREVFSKIMENILLTHYPIDMVQKVNKKT